MSRNHEALLSAIRCNPELWPDYCPYCGVEDDRPKDEHDAEFHPWPWDVTPEEIRLIGMGVLREDCHPRCQWWHLEHGQCAGIKGSAGHRHSAGGNRGLWVQGEWAPDLNADA